MSRPPNIEPDSIRFSRRAKLIRIIVDAFGSVELVIPMSKTLAEGMDFLQHKKQWVQRHIRLSGDIPRDVTQVPGELRLRLLGETYCVSYCAQQKHLAISSGCNNETTYKIHSGRHTEIKNRLNFWLRQMAKRVLLEKMHVLSEDIQLPFKRLSIRTQRTRWGSCSDKANISLNDRLLFLDPALVRYVMVHELCHTKHLDHSRQFWGLVMTHEPRFQQHRQALKLAVYQIPPFLSHVS